MNRALGPLRQYIRGEPLWHVSSQAYSAGQAIGPHASFSPHWLRMQGDPKRGPVEQVFENARPPTIVTRRLCVFGTDSPAMIAGFVKQRPNSMVYRVEVPGHAAFSGRFDMKLVTSAASPLAAAQAYWTGAASAFGTPYPEVLATEFMVVENLGAKFSADLLVALNFRDLTLDDLVKGVIDLPPE